VPVLEVAQEGAAELGKAIGAVLEDGEYGVALMLLEADERAAIVERTVDRRGSDLRLRPAEDVQRASRPTVDPR
jgi:hypothetical protein